MADSQPVQGSGTATAGGSSPPKAAATWSSLTGVAAIVVLLAFGVLVVFMLGKTASADTPDSDWSRLTYIFGSVEAIVFAAAGAIFGTTVQRSQTVRAEQRADSQQQRADAHTEDAAKGRTLAKAAKRAAASAPGGREVEGFGAGASRPAVDLADLAEELFPE
jgi:hypothetical protein